jgi:hypothetical protein
MEYLFSKCEIGIVNGGPATIIPPWAIERWTNQLQTPYSGLCEEEKESDRKEADRFIALLSTRPGSEDSK